MSRIIVLSEDRVFSGLVSRNLQQRGHQVAAHLLNAGTIGSPYLLDLVAKEGLVTLDLDWFDSARLATYRRMVALIAGLRKTVILLVDSTWPKLWADQFGATVTLHKPFSIDHVVQAVEQYNRMGGEAAEV